MKEIKARNIFDCPKNSNEAVCITTNGVIKQNGLAVMGAGIARAANEKYSLAVELGEHLRFSGNVPHVFSQRGPNGCYLISFPTKSHWKDFSDLKLIEQSAKKLIQLVDKYNIKTCYLVPPGCGLGNLNWEQQVKPLLCDLLDDRFIVVLR